MLVPLGSMRLVLVVAVVMETAPSPTQAAPSSIGDILTGVLGTFIENAFKTQEITLLDRYCTLGRRAYLHKVELRYKAEVTCPGWTTIKGKGSGHSNALNSENDALKDFMTQAVARGLVTREDAAPWLDH
ncbi:Anti-lipopolysaccharide factor [Chionoecetes opilio]|uniref:Anti-lipopolysaccharide factor n=1 Tax=Chionoecetes opilio TaxID=41210 RepID=A0A8J5CNU2_CHIOP|nr:Anti-lipopolysaccharide factor [Chionoecetes opilio]